MSAPKIILFGFSRASIEIATKLQAQGHAFRIVDSDATLQAKANKMGFNLFVADYGEDETLTELGIGEDVTFVFCLFDDDVQNVFLTLTIRALDPNVQIITTTHTKDAIHKLEIAGANIILDPYQITGKKIYKLITQPDVIQVVEKTIFGEEDVNVAQVTITAHSPLNAKLLSECTSLQSYNMLLLGIHDKQLKKEFIFITEGYNHTLDEGDVLVVVGEDAEIQRFKTDFFLQ